MRRLGTGFLLVAAITTAVHAGNSQGGSNGQPFQDLQAAVEEAKQAAEMAIAAEQAARESGDQALASAIATEADARAAADAAEAAARAAADAAEAIARAQADAELQNQISANAEQIAANAAAIDENRAALQAAVATIEYLQTEVVTVSGQAASLQFAMEEAFGQIGELQASDDALAAAIAANGDLLHQLRQDYNATAAQFESQIALLSQDVAWLAGSVPGELLGLHEMINQLSQLVSGIDFEQDVAIAQLQSQALGLLADVALMQTDLHAMMNMLGQVSADIGRVDSAINELGGRLMSLESRVGTLECLPGHPADPCSVRITSPGEAYGHHGRCEGWNGCGDAATCAQWACEVKGYSQLVSYGEARPCTQFGNCHLFYRRGSVQYNWGNWCPVMGVTDIDCK